jgi:4-aminobutyrate aminotransferase-like enzyme
MVKLLSYGQTWKIINDYNLLHLQKDTSSFLKIELDRIAEKTGLISNVRGYGTHLGFDSDHSSKLQRWFHRTGINIHKCGPNTFALRPSLVLGCKDAAQLRESLENYHPNFE